MSLRVLRSGLLTTVQDLGRPGLGAIGVPVGGAMDPWCLRLANRLVGNDDATAALEITLAGPELLFEENAFVAMTGARFEVVLDERAIPNGETIEVRAGERLSVGRAVEGLRGYLAVAGGIDAEVVLGSRSTYLPGALGGADGRPLRAGDHLAIGRVPRRPPRRRVRSDLLDPRSAAAAARVVLGPQAEAFSAAGIASFLSTTYRVSPRSDRMGVRLEGPPIELIATADIAPEGLVHGAVQVPADGQPIVLGADRPATGGYTKIATVVTADLGIVAQVRPGDELRFAAVSVEDARRSWREREELLASGVETIGS
jgi:antagonist of KipI